jgi:hypothetical protein
MTKMDDSILLHIALVNSLQQKPILKFMTKNLWPLLMLLKNGARVVSLDVFQENCIPKMSVKRIPGGRLPTGGHSTWRSALADSHSDRWSVLRLTVRMWMAAPFNSWDVDGRSIR